MTSPLVVLDLDAPPRSGNRALRQHWATRRREAAQWRLRVAAAVGGRLVPEVSNHMRRRVVARWTAPLPPDTDRALTALAPVVDALKGWQMRKVGGAMVRVNTGLWLIANDDPDHLVLEYAPERGSPRRLVMEVYDA